MATEGQATLDPIRDRKVQVVRDTVSERAIALFFSVGYETTTIDAIAKAAGIGRRTFFRYFESKEAAVLWRLERFGTHAARLVQGRPHTEPPLQAMHSALRDAADFYLEDPARTRALLGLVESTPALFAASLVQRERFKAVFAEALAPRFGRSAADLSPCLAGALAIETLAVGVRRWLADAELSLLAMIDVAFRELGSVLEAPTRA